MFGLLLISNSSSKVNYFFVLQSSLIGITAIFLIISVKGLLAQVVGVFFLIAFCCFPILEMLTNTIYWGGSNLNLIDRSLANLCVFVFLVVFIFGYRLPLSIPILVNRLFFPASLNLWQQLVFLGVIIVCFGYLIFLYDSNYLSLFFRGGSYHAGLNVESKTTYLLVEFFLRPLIFNMGLYLFISTRNKSAISVFALLMGICAVFPTGVPRFLAAAMYLPFLLHWAFSQANYRRMMLNFTRLYLPNILIFGLFIIFPVLDIFRTFSFTNDISTTVWGLDSMLAGHFDGFQMLVRAINVGELTYGYGFMGTLLFFVPRVYWPTKPIGSAQEVARAANLSFDNVSMTLVGEFFLNFWYFGVVFGALIFAIIIRSIDLEFLKEKKYEISPRWILYFQSAGLLLFILRGSILSAFAYSVSVVLTWLLIWLICGFLTISQQLSRR